MASDGSGFNRDCRASVNEQLPMTVPEKKHSKLIEAGEPVSRANNVDADECASLRGPASRLDLLKLWMGRQIGPPRSEFSMVHGADLDHGSCSTKSLDGKYDADQAEVGASQLTQERAPLSELENGCREIVPDKAENITISPTSENELDSLYVPEGLSGRWAIEEAAMASSNKIRMAFPVWKKNNSIGIKSKKKRGIYCHGSDGERLSRAFRDRSPVK